MSAHPCKRFFASVATRGHSLRPARAAPAIRLALTSRKAASARRPASPCRCGMKSRTYPRKFKSGSVLIGGFEMTETAPDVGEHEGSIPSYCCRLFGTGIGDRLHADCARKIRPRGCRDSWHAGALNSTAPTADTRCRWRGRSSMGRSRGRDARGQAAAQRDAWRSTSSKLVWRTSVPLTM